AAQVMIDDEKLSLAGAISRMGGLDANTANAASVMVFRFERPEVAGALGLTQPANPRGVPVIYQVNLRDPAGYFIADQFQVQDGDLIYVPRADTVEARRFFELATSISQVAYDLSVPGLIR
ncbi:MAG: polysaccharide export protein, partial [Caulobacteraceae bacterium]|nr:polysaccharide export protein [Caulobacteraceae bacterium]